MTHYTQGEPTDSSVLSLLDTSPLAPTSQKTLTLTLPRPIPGKHEPWSALELREPCFAECMAASRKVGEKVTLEAIYEADIELVHLISGWPREILDQLPASLLNQATTFVSSFQNEAEERFQETSEKPEPEKTLIFDPPINGGGQEYMEMRLHEPTVAQNRRYKAIQTKPTLETILRADLLLLELVSGWQRAALMKLPISRFIEARTYLTTFFTIGLEIGNSSQQI